MVDTPKKPLEAVDLIKLFGKIYFTWNLRTDHMKWKGPINKLFNTNIPFLTGSAYLNRTTTESFWQRFVGIKETLHNDFYSTSYCVVLPNRTLCTVKEEGHIIRNSKGNPDRLEGYITVSDDQTPPNLKNFTGYDSLTGFPNREILIENLKCLLEQTKGEVAPGGYLTFCIDKLSLIFFVYGLEALQLSVKGVGKALQRATRFNDSIGRVSGCCFGIALKDADEWGVFQAADRLSTVCHSLKIKTKIEVFSPTVSVGGAAFRDDLSPLEILHQAEQGLLEMQNLKGSGIKMQETSDIRKQARAPISSEKGKRRIADEKAAHKKQPTQDAG